MPPKELSPKEFEQLNKQFFTTAHKKGIGVLQTNLSEEEINRDIKKIFDQLDEEGGEYIHTLEVKHDDGGGKRYLIHRDNVGHE
jgi:thiamine phosphate synthase YjbQ (UPF0047 family)